MTWAGIGLSMLCAPLAAQQTERGAIPVIANSEASYANLPAQPVGANDLLAVSVYDAPELTRTVRVSHDGNIRLPMVKEPIPVEGMIPSQVESAITTALENGNVMVDPIVTVTIVEYQSRPITVTGAVREPVVFQATRPIRLLDAIARAGGIREDAGSDILVRLHQGSDTSVGKESATEKIPVRQLIDQADPNLNLLLQGGEEVLVPEATKIYVVGNVRKPGAFPVRNDEETTVLQALALSEGLTPFATKEAFIYRRATSGTRTEIPISLDKIMKRKSPDVALQPNDILYIPDSKGRRLTAETLDRITGLGGQAAVNYLIWR